MADLTYRQPKVLLYRQALMGFISLTGLVVLYYAAASSGVSAANYMAFSSAYGLVSGAFTALIGIVSTLTEFSPMLLDDVTPDIAPGEYIAIAGVTGCGKSTLMRMMPGFESRSRRHLLR